MVCNKNCQKKFDEKLEERFLIACKFPNYDNNKFVLFLQKGAYPYKYVDDWENLNEMPLPVKKDFYSLLNMGGITDADYVHAKRVFKYFEIKTLGEYHNLSVQSNTLLSADVVENFRNMFLELYKLDPTKFLSAPGMTSQAALKKTKVKLDLLTDTNMLLMVGKVLEEEYATLFIDMLNNKKYMKNYDNNKESAYLQYWDVNNLYGRAMLQKLPANSFGWIKDTS